MHVGSHRPEVYYRQFFSLQNGKALWTIFQSFLVQWAFLCLVGTKSLRVKSWRKYPNQAITHFPDIGPLLDCSKLSCTFSSEL